MTQDHQRVHLPRDLANWMGIVMDLVGSISLVLYVLILGPLWILRGPLLIQGWLSYLRVLVPQRLVMRSVRAALDWRLGHYDAAMAESEAIVAACEDYLREMPQSRPRRRVLAELYTMLARAYMHAGHIDTGMMVVIRAKKTLRIERLPGLADLDAKTAHLVRAGLAAGRLLDGNGLATMFVKTTPHDSSSKSPAGRSSTPDASQTSLDQSPAGENAPSDSSKRDGHGPALVPAAVLGKVIPFRCPQPVG
jgi:hypothetical protein